MIIPVNKTVKPQSKEEADEAAAFHFRVRVAGHENHLGFSPPDASRNIGPAERNRLEQNHHTNLPGTERRGKGYLYYPAAAEEDCQLAEGRSFLNRVYEGSLSKMVLGFVNSGSLSREELQELRELLNRQEESHDDSQ